MDLLNNLWSLFVDGPGEHISWISSHINLHFHHLLLQILEKRLANVPKTFWGSKDGIVLALFMVSAGNVRVGAVDPRQLSTDYWTTWWKSFQKLFQGLLKLTSAVLTLEWIVQLRFVTSSFLGQVGQRLIGETSTPNIPGFSSVKVITEFDELSFVLVIPCYEYQNQNKWRWGGYLP
jgi:hypothetical protein